MTATVAKVGNAGAAFKYYSERDDYYLSDKKSAEWYGHGAGRLGLGGEIKPQDFHDVLTGRFRAANVGQEGRHTPGWDMTFSAPKSVSVAALVNKDERLTKAHDAAVRAALDQVERLAIVTRQRDATGDYKWTPTGNMVAGIVRHSTSRNADPQLHSHGVIANMTRDPATGNWVSIDSRAGLFNAQREAGNVYMNTLAEGARRAGYTVEWRVDERGNAVFELAEIPDAERSEFSSRRKEIEAQLAARGVDVTGASGAARQAATLDTRSPKEHVPGAVLHARWQAQAEARGFTAGARPKGHSKPDAAQRMRAARAAVAQGIASISERATRFTRRELLAEATTYAQGKATQNELQTAVVEAHESGTLIDRGTQVRGFDKSLTGAAGFTTKAALETESAMLRRAATLAGRAPSLPLSSGAVDSLIAAREQSTGHAFTSEQRAATAAILADGSGLAIVQGYAGTAKTTSVLATVADAARGANVRVRAIAPTHSAADTLGQAIGADSTTVAALNSKPLERDGRPEIWVVDEAGMIAAADMKKLLERADQSGAQVILTGDTKQIGSVGAGSAFQQLQNAHPGKAHSLTDIKRQTSAELRNAVYDSLQGNFSDALGKVDTREIRDREAAVGAIADEYIRQQAAGKSTLVVTLSRADRSDVNAAIQQRREQAGEVNDTRPVATLSARQWTEAERADASRYAAGDVIEAGRNFKHGPQRGELATVEKVENGRVTARLASGEAWTFDPARVKAFQVLERGEQRIGAGDKIVAKGAIYTRDAADPSKRVQVKNGTAMQAEGVAANGTLVARLADGRRIAIDTRQGAKVDLDYASTANAAQGRTVDSAIAYMRSGQTNLADRQHSYVALSRARERAVVITDDKAKLAETLSKSSHGKETARENRVETQAQPQPGAAQGRAVDPMDEQRPLSAWAKEWSADMKARFQNAREDARLREREREQEKYARQDRKWLVKGNTLAKKIDRRSAQIERDITRRSGVKMDRGALGQFFFENKSQHRARQAIERIRAGRDSAQAKIGASLNRAFERSVAREMRTTGASAEVARERVGERTLIDRDYRFEKAMYAAGSAITRGADVAANTVNKIWDRVQELRAQHEQARAAAHKAETSEPTPFDTPAEQQQRAEARRETEQEHSQGREAERNSGPEMDL